MERNNKQSENTARKTIRNFITSKGAAARMSARGIFFGIYALTVLLFGTVFNRSVFGGGTGSYDLGQCVFFLVIAFALGLLSFTGFRNVRIYKRRARNSLEGLSERGGIVRAAEELQTGSKTVFGESYKRGRSRTVLTEHYIFSKRLASAADYNDIMWYYYQPAKMRFGKQAGYIVAYSKDIKNPYFFFMGTDDPEGAAKQVMQTIAQKNPDAVYGAENKKQYHALLGQAENGNK